MSEDNEQKDEQKTELPLLVQILIGMLFFLAFQYMDPFLMGAIGLGLGALWLLRGLIVAAIQFVVRAARGA